jgi:hypothetical protein
MLVPVSDVDYERDEMKATKITCKKNPNDEKQADINNGSCPKIKGCVYNWDSTGRKFISFAGYRYAKEFDNCPTE